MNPSERAQRVAELVETALERSPDEWSRHLRENCPDDTALRAEVKSLLGYRDEAADFIEAPAYQASAAALAAEDSGELKRGDMVGDYRILALLGEGGMGEVYLADDTRLGRQVAIKLVKRGFGRANLIRHFRQEERILAALNDPHIARLYDAAVTADGVPYFVMEYVEGERLDIYCELHQLSIRQRLELFRKICSAVSYAHQRLIIHRDLKPANIRVTAAGEPKLLDFGIAKLLDDSATPSEQTMTLGAVMTPDYASPEQVRGERMTTQSDVYSLGVILYELLTGEKPYSTTGRRADEISRAITEQTPPRPSTVTAANRQSSISNQKLLKGDLDNIVLMAMRKEPERRYPSVAQLSEDIRRHLEGRPVAARKDTWRYRSSKFIRRNKALATAAALTVLALIGGIVMTSWQARVARIERARAEHRFNDVRKLANSYLFEFHDAIENLPGSTPARALLVRRALEYLDSLAREASDDQALQREVVMAYLKVGNVQGNPRNANLGDSAGAMESYRKALAIAEKWSAPRGDTMLRRPVALLYEKMADVLTETNQVQEGVGRMRAALDIYREIADANAADPAARISVAIAHLKLGDYLGNPNFVNAGESEAAMENYRAALSLFQSLHSADRQNARVRRFLGMMHERLGAMFALRNDAGAAAAEYQLSADIRVPMAAEFPNDSTMLRDAAIAYEKLGAAMSATGDLDAALINRQKSLDLFRALHAADRQNVMAQHSLAISHVHLADLLGGAEPPNLGRPAEAATHYQSAIDLLEGINRADAANAATRRDLAEAQSKLAKLARR
jgi:non-specific serine/threonine protein kinase/serine/threonine-protein kinase